MLTVFSRPPRQVLCEKFDTNQPPAYLFCRIYMFPLSVACHISLTCMNNAEGGPEQDRHDERDARDLLCSSVLLEDDQSCLVSPGEILLLFRTDRWDGKEASNNNNNNNIKRKQRSLLELCLRPCLIVDGQHSVKKSGRKQ